MTWLAPQPSPKAIGVAPCPLHLAPGEREGARDEAMLETESSHPPPFLHLWFSGIVAMLGSTWDFLSPPPHPTITWGSFARFLIPGCGEKKNTKPVIRCVVGRGGSRSLPSIPSPPLGPFQGQA